MRTLVSLIVGWLALQTLLGYLFRRSRRKVAGTRRHFLVTQGGGQYHPTGDEVQDAVLSVMMGGVVLDLREVQLETRPAKIDALVAMGGVQVVVPTDWNVRLDARPIFGGVRDARRGRVPQQATPDLVVSGQVIMGGLEVTDILPQQASTAETRREEAA